MLSSKVVRSTNPAYPLSDNQSLDLTISQTLAPGGAPISREVQISESGTTVAPTIYYAGLAAGQPAGAIGMGVRPQSFIILARP